MVLSKKEVGLLIKKARNIKSQTLGKKYTQEMLANDLSLSRGYIGDIENGRTYPNYVLLNQISDACNVPFTFFGDINFEIKHAINEKFSNLTEKDKKDLLDFTIMNKHNIDESIEVEILDLDEAYHYLQSYRSYEENIKKFPENSTPYGFHELTEEDDNKVFYLDNKEKVKKLVFKTPEEAVVFLLQQPEIMNYGNYDFKSIAEDEINDLINDLLITLKVSLERRKINCKNFVE